MANRWIGRWVVGVSALHSIFGLLAFTPVLHAMLKNGMWNSVGADPMRGAVSWFLLSGGFMLVCGLAIDACERGGGSLRPAGWSLLAVTIITIVWMPVSGAWLLLPPSIAMLWRRSVG